MVCNTFVAEGQARQKVNLQQVYYVCSNNHLLCWCDSLFSLCLKDQRLLWTNLGLHTSVLIISPSTTVKYLDSLCVLYFQPSLSCSCRNPPMSTPPLLCRFSLIQLAALRNMVPFFKELKYLHCKNSSPCVPQEFTCGQILLEASALSEVNASLRITGHFPLGSGATWNNMMLTMLFSSFEILFKFNFQSFTSQQNLAALPFEKLKVKRKKISLQVHLCREKVILLNKLNVSFM